LCTAGLAFGFARAFRWGADLGLAVGVFLAVFTARFAFLTGLDAAFFFAVAGRPVVRRSFAMSQTPVMDEPEHVDVWRAALR
jgi:hypothetical protein